MSQKVFDRTLAASATTGDLYMIDPREIRLSPEFNGRQELPPIDDLIEDFQNPRVGQIQAAKITKDYDGAPLLLAGHRRWRTAVELTKRKVGPFSGVFKLRCEYFKGSPMECFVLTVKENLSRVDPSPIDDGFNISRLHHNFGMTPEEIALKVYGRRLTDGSADIKWVQERMALAELAPEAAAAVTGGKVKPNAVLELAKLSKTAQRALLKSAEGKITAAVVRRATAPSVNGSSHQDSSATPSDAPRAGKQPNTTPKWDKATVCAKIQEWIEMELPPHIASMTVENAVRTVLGQIQDEIHCGDR